MMTETDLVEELSARTREEMEREIAVKKSEITTLESAVALMLPGESLGKMLARLTSLKDRAGNK